MKRICLIIATAFGLTTYPAVALPGDLDATFGVGGIVMTSISGTDTATCMALQSDGKIVVGGYSTSGGNTNFALVRYHNDGTLDTTFNSTGKVTTDFAGQNDFANGMVIQSDGKIVVVGSASSTAVPALVRYNTDGSLDTGFGPSGTGKITTPSFPNYPLQGVALQQDGKIVVAGDAPNFAGGIVMRYHADGSLDNGFGSGGLVSIFTPTMTYNGNYALVVQSDGKIVVAGSINGTQSVTRLNEDGSRDLTFGSAGGQAGTNGYSFGGALVLQPGGNIICASRASVSGGKVFYMTGLTATGSLNAGFGSGGVVQTGIGIFDDSIYSAALQSDGKIVAAGYSYNGNTTFNDFALVRYNSNGSVDTSFHTTGKVTNHIGSGNAGIRSVAIAADGRIIAAGNSSGGFTLARYYGLNVPPLVTTGGATGIVRNGAVIDGTVNPNSLATTAHFEYGLTTNYGSVTTDQALGNGHTTTTVSSIIGGLTDNTLYHYRLAASNAAGTTYGEDAIFTTAPNPPLAFTGDASNVSATGATLVGVVIPNGRVTTAYFELGLSTAYGTQTDSQMIPAEGTVVDVFAPLAGLVPGATYHFRLVAVNAGSPIPITGVDKTFVAQAPPPVVTLGAVAPLTTTGVSLTGTVNANGASTQVFFDHGTDGTTFPNSVTAAPATVSGTSTTAVSGSLGGLSQGVTYYYRLRAVNAGGTTTSGVGTFTLDLLSGLNQTFPGTAPDAQGFVFVNLAPSGLLHGWRFIGEQQWRASGVPVGGLTTGDREIEFRPVPGYIQPPQETVSVISGEAATLLTRDYFVTATTGSGGLSVTLKPDSILSGAGRAQWRLLGENDTQWRDSGSTLTGLVPGSYLVECKAVTGRATPPPANVIVSNAQTALPTITYFLPDSPTGTPPSVLAFETVSTDTTKPYAHVGQIRSNVGSSSGFVVKARVVATAGHVVWDDGTLSAAQGLQWLFQRHRGTYEPKPISPRGFYLFDGYAAQRVLDNSPGDSSPQSQHLDVAAMYFNEDAGRGGYGGFLASDLAQNEFLISSAQKMLVGYPVDGIASGSQGRMHATAPANVLFTAAFGRTFTTTGIRSSGGNSGGPLCVQFEGGNYYPAAIYLGGSNQTVVRAIDSSVIDLFNRAEVSGNGGGNQTGGGITHTSVSTFGSAANPGAIKVLIEPAGAITAGAGWRLSPETSYRQSGAQKSGLNAGNYVLQLPTVAGYPAPDPQSVTVTGGQLATVTFTYGSTASPIESWRQTYFGSTANSGNAADAFDFDKDGFTNAQEYAAGTNPTSAGDYFKAENATRSTNTFSVSTAGKAGRTYVLERSTTMAANSWITVTTQGPLGSDATVTLSDAATPSNAAFYRIRVTGP